MAVEIYQIQKSFMLAIIFLLNIIGQGLGEEHYYISKPYFEKHEILDESKFESFLLNNHEISQKTRMLAIHRNLIGEGSHRRLLSSIRLESSSEVFTNPCVAIFIESLPSGVFADPFELQHLVQKKVFKDAVVFGDTNLELPSFRSNRSLVEVHLGISPTMLSRDHKELEINAELPLHARYQPLGHGFSRVEFGLPDVLLRCRVEGNMHKQSCFIVPTDQSAKSPQDGSIVWEVPCGNKEHAGVVSIVTFISAILAAFLIVLTSVSYSKFAVASDLKQS